MSNSPIVQPQTFTPSSLFQSGPDSYSERNSRSIVSLYSRNLGRKPVWSRTKLLQVRAFRLLHQIRRSIVIVAASLLVWVGAAGIRTPPSHASTATVTASQSRTSLLSASLDQIVHRYVQDHMFDDDVYEPVESVYREAMGDKIKGNHPKALSEITSSILGQDGMKVDKSSSSSSSSSGIGDWLMNSVSFLQRKGLSESTAIIVLTGTFVVAGPVMFLLGAMMVGSQSKRQIQSVMKKRYGDTYTVDATVKVEEDVQVPDEDDDDDDEEGDDDDDDDDKE